MSMMDIRHRRRCRRRGGMEQQHRTRELALFNLRIDSKLRGCDLVALKVRDIQQAWGTTRGTRMGNRPRFPILCPVFPLRCNGAT